MNKLITTMKPRNSYQPVKSKLSSNAQKYIFPICEQMILFKRPGIRGQFINARISVKLKDINNIVPSSTALGNQPNQTDQGKGSFLAQSSTAANSSAQPSKEKSSHPTQHPSHTDDASTQDAN